ncbi:hypothetical protein Golax_023047 [Gossypium laxum]|uniref:Uncharacterized protein n=1 Tax=Gossypium laxum TaxID=34288 RepID=A0A7J9B330_9ROSI|nr:hypothetical protein [Gossypium laxum]
MMRAGSHLPVSIPVGNAAKKERGGGASRSAMFPWPRFGSTPFPFSSCFASSLSGGCLVQVYISPLPLFAYQETVSDAYFLCTCLIFFLFLGLKAVNVEIKDGRIVAIHHVEMPLPLSDSQIDVSLLASAASPVASVLQNLTVIDESSVLASD